jgi:acetate kinase
VQFPLSQSFGNDGLCAPPDFFGIVLHPAWLRIDLLVLLLGDRYDACMAVEHDEACTGGPLVNRTDVTRHNDSGYIQFDNPALTGAAGLIPALAVRPGFSVMKILVLNSGSSSLKFQLIETTGEQRLAKGEITKIGSEVPNHDEALKAAFQQLKESGTALEDIKGVGHRVVHGGEHFSQSAIIDDHVLHLIENASKLAPLHNPANLKGYYASKALLPHATHVAVFDTAFHQTLAPHAYLYGLPYLYYTRDKIRRYGFHGTSYRYVSERFSQVQPDASKIIACHLGNGCSVCAINAGKSVDTSMGFTPLEGLLMGTRSGDIDAGAVMFIAGREGIKLETLLNEQSGLLGISGVSNDMQDVLAEAGKGNSQAELAVQIFCYRVTKYIGAYFAAMDGADAIIFTAGIGEHAANIRARICNSLGALGMVLDSSRNDSAIGKETQISAEGASPSVWVIPTDEELVIARDTMRAIAG